MQLKLLDTWKSQIEYEIEQSIKHLNSKNTDYFVNLLPKSEYYRIALAFPEDTLFVDIETTGLSRYYDDITLIGWCFKDQYSVYIKGELTSDFLDAVGKAAAVVTFNGSQFDLPFIRQEFPDIRVPMCHIDLRYFSKILGVSGGQKLIEEHLGFERPAIMEKMRGESAPLLWFKYQLGDQKSLEELIYYNFFDIEGMKYILDHAIQVSLERSMIPRKDVLPTPYFKRINAHNTHPSEFCHSFNISIPLIKEEPGPALLLNDLWLKKYDSEQMKVVGIDLSGSEKRFSGWCLLEGSSARTKRISTDQDLIDKTLEAKPDIISIDSPLSLPCGRKTVFDDDPGRAKYGIMRQCERILKKRGINVYPSLIQSMQGLTKRGIELANYFRNLGIPVIESYPGAAQDILRIPRKGVSTEYLMHGLGKFGIIGEYLENEVTHDELDAITSAIVALSFWDGRFEALGNKDEDYLIIPRIDVDTQLWRKRIVIGVSGPIATGKTTAGSYYQEKGFSYGRYSQVLEEMARTRSLEPSRENLQEIGIEVNREYGQRWLASQMIEKLGCPEHIVIDGLRFPEDNAFLAETFGPGFVHVFIESPAPAREDRYLKEGHSLKEYKKAVAHRVEQDVSRLHSSAHAAISNDGSIEEFHRKLDSLISSLSK